MKKTNLFPFLMSLFLLACSAPRNNQGAREDFQIPTKLIFAAPKIKELTPEMKKTYQDWILLIATAEKNQNCQTDTKASPQKNRLLISGDTVQLMTKIKIDGFYCPLRSDSISDFNFKILSNDRLRQLMKASFTLKATSDIAILDPNLIQKSQLSSLKQSLSVSGVSAYLSARPTQIYKTLLFTSTAETSAGENVLLSASGEISEALGEKIEKWSAVLKTKDLELEITAFQKNGIRQTYLNGHLLVPTDLLSEFPIPQINMPAVTLENI